MATSPPKQSESRVRIKRKEANVVSIQQRLSDDVRFTLVQIPEGDFLMGSPEDEESRYDNESPQHRVHVPEFWMGQYPVTQEEWRVVASDFPKVNRDLTPDPSRFKGDRNPVEQVSWYDAVEFCDRLSAQSGFHYRLPSEAEWEYACRAGTTTPFHFGETISTRVANYNGADDQYGAYGRGEKGDYRRTTNSVVAFEVTNAWGLSEMHGNVWEWCLDHWHENYKGAPTDGSAWLTDDPESNRVIRGGSWDNNPRNCRSAYRDPGSPDYQDYSLGFRVILAPRSA